MTRNPTPRKGEQHLAASLAVCEGLEELRRDFKRTERKLIARRRRLWLKAVEAPGSQVDRQRIVAECGVSIQLVDGDLREARAEREARG